jgi:hypothetical protein
VSHVVPGVDNPVSECFEVFGCATVLLDDLELVIFRSLVGVVGRMVFSQLYVLL